MSYTVKLLSGILSGVCACVHVYVCVVFAHVCLHVYSPVHVHMWGPEVDLGFLLLFLYTLVGCSFVFMLFGCGVFFLSSLLPSPPSYLLKQGLTEPFLFQ